MQKKITLIIALLFVVGTSFAQRIVYVDTEYVLKKMPQYESAKEELVNISAKWNEEIEKKQTQLGQKESEFNQEKNLLPDTKKLAKEKEINQLRTEINQLKNKRFGPKGDLFQKQQALIQPIQDEIYNAIKKLAERRDFDFVLDKSKGVSILFVKPEYDMSDEVLRILSKNQTTK